MAADWYCEIDGKQRGPVTSLQLKQLADAGKLQPADPVWKEGMQTRVPARSVKGLFDAPAAEAPKRPAPAPPKEEELVEFEMIEESTEELVEFETLEPIEEPPAKPAKKTEKEPEEDEPEPELLAEVPAIYREGLPDLDGPVTGTLILESTGLRFQFKEDGEEDEYPLPFKKIDNILEPAKGDFPPSMKKKALGAKLGGKAGKLASGLVGKWLGGTAGDVVSKVGSEASGMAESGGNLGKPPRNRLTVVARLRKQTCKIYFDVSGGSREEMNEEAKVFFKQIQKARDKDSKADADAEAETTNVNVTVHSPSEESKEAPARQKPAAVSGMAALTAAPPMAGKPFRVMSGGRVRGPFSLAELRGLLTGGQLGDSDLIGVESWLPVSTLSGLLAGAPAAPAGAKADEEDEEEDEEILEDMFEEAEEDEKPEEKKPVAAKKNDDDTIAMDDDFKLS